MAHKTFLPPSPKMASERPQDLEEDGYGTVELSPKKEAGATYAPIFFRWSKAVLPAYFWFLHILLTSA